MTTSTTAITSSLDQLPDEASRAPALLLRLVMAELGCSWASFHEEVAGALRLVASTSAAPTGRHGLFDLLGTGAELDAIVVGIADRAMQSRRPVLLNRTNALGVGLPSGSAIAAPLVDQDLKAVGAVTLLCEDGGRAWTSDEAKLLGWCAQLLAMHAQRAQLAEQAAWVASLGDGDAAAAQTMAARVAKVVTELKEAHTCQLVEERLAWEKEKEELAMASGWEEERQRLLAEHDAQLAALQAKWAEMDAIAPAPSPAPTPPRKPTTPSKAATPPPSPGNTKPRHVELPKKAAAPPEGGVVRADGSLVLDGHVGAMGSQAMAGKKITVKPIVDVQPGGVSAPTPPPPNWEKRELPSVSCILYTEAEEDTAGDGSPDVYKFHVEVTSRAQFGRNSGAIRRNSSERRLFRYR